MRRQILEAKFDLFVFVIRRFSERHSDKLSVCLGKFDKCRYMLRLLAHLYFNIPLGLLGHVGAGLVCVLFLAPRKPQTQNSVFVVVLLVPRLFEI